MGGGKETSWRGLAQHWARPLPLLGHLPMGPPPTMMGQACPRGPRSRRPYLFSWQLMGPARTNSTAGRRPPPAPSPTHRGMRRTAW